MKGIVKKILSYLNRAKKELIVIATVIFLDLLSKYLIASNIELHERVTVIPKFLHFFYTLNTGAAFSFDFGLTKLLGENGVRTFFIVLMGVAVLGFLTALILGNKKHFLFRLSLALIIGGAIGNLYDRIVHGAVRDFVEIEYFGKNVMGNRTFAIFNLADSALVIGVILLTVYVLYHYGKDSKASDEDLKSFDEGSNIVA